MTAPTLTVPGLEEHHVQVAGRRVRYLRCGAGPHLALVHGLLGYSYCWRKNYAALGEQFTVTALDLPGVGFSDRDPQMDCSLAASSDRLLDFLRLLDIRDFTMLGNSYGGAIAMMATIKLLDSGWARVRSLILAGSVHPWLEGNPLLPLAQTRFAQAVFPVAAPLVFRMRPWFFRRMYGDPRRIEPGTAEAYAAPTRLPGTIRHVMKIVKCWKSDMAQLESALPKLSALPILLLWGDRDRAVPLRSVARFRSALPHAEYRVFKSGGHLIFEEMPDDFNRAVIDFAERHAR